MSDGSSVPRRLCASRSGWAWEVNYWLAPLVPLGLPACAAATQAPALPIMLVSSFILPVVAGLGYLRFATHVAAYLEQEAESESIVVGLSRGSQRVIVSTLRARARLMNLPFRGCVLTLYHGSGRGFRQYVMDVDEGIARRFLSEAGISVSGL